MVMNQLGRMGKKRLESYLFPFFMVKYFQQKSTGDQNG